jgi:hypothetical protein
MRNGKVIFIEIDMVRWNMRQSYLLEVDMTQIPTNHETLFVICYVNIHVNFSSMIICLDP